MDLIIPRFKIIEMKKMSLIKITFVLRIFDGSHLVSSGTNIPILISHCLATWDAGKGLGKQVLLITKKI